MPTEANVLSDRIYQFCLNIEEQKRQRDLFATVATQHYAGRMYYDWSPGWVTSPIDAELFNKGLQLPYANGVLDSIAATILAMTSTPECTAATTDSDDLRSAQMGSAILRDHQRRNGGDRVLRAAGMDAVLTGLGVIRTSYDPSELGTLLLPPEQMDVFEKATQIVPQVWSKTAGGKIRATCQLGGTREDAIDSCLLYIETGTRNWASVRRFAVVEYMSVLELQSKFPEQADKIEAMMINTTYGFGERVSNLAQPFMAWTLWNQQDGMSFDPRAGMIRVVDFWEKLDNGTWDRALVTGPRCELLLEHQTSWPTHPYTVYLYKPIPNMFWPKGAYKDMQPSQRVVNVITTRALTHLRDSIKDVVFLPMGSKWQPNNNSTSVGYYDPNGGGVPIYQPVSPALWNYLSAVLHEFIDHLKQLGQVSSIARGDMPDRISGKAAQRAIEVNAGPFMQVRADWVESEKEKFRKILMLAQQFYTLPRMGVIAGDRSEYMIECYTGADITQGTDVAVVEADKSLQGQLSRLDFIMTVGDQGYLDDGGAQKLQRAMRFAQSGTIEAIYSPDEERNQRMAEQHFLWIVQGKVLETPPTAYPFGAPGMDNAQMGGQVALQQPGAPQEPVSRPGQLIFQPTGSPLVDEYQDHGLQVKQNIADLQRPGNPPEVNRLLKLLIAEHQNYIAQAQAADLKAQADQAAAMASAQAEGQLKSILLSARVDHVLKGSGGSGGNGKAPSINASGSQGGTTTHRTGANVGKGKYAGKSAA